MHALMHATSNQNDSNPNILYFVKVLANYTLCIRKCIYICIYIYIDVCVYVYIYIFMYILYKINDR